MMRLLLPLLAALLVFACGDGSGGRGRKAKKNPPTNLTYALLAPDFRVGIATQALVPSVEGTVDAWSVTPALPPGLALDTLTGVISGVPTVAAPPGDYSVAAENAGGRTKVVLSIAVGASLPPAVESLDLGFTIQLVAGGLSVPVKLAFLPDARLLFTELSTGNIRLIDAAGILRAEPFATLSVRTGGERGLLGIAVAPDFASSGHLFVFRVTPAGDGKPDRSQVVRLTAVGDTGTDPVVIVDDLPVGIVQNGGDVRFGPDGKLYVTVGHTGNPPLAQTDGSLAGRILRYEPDGTIPADNPDPQSPEWARGLRNSFDLAFHPTTGGLFASENGPTFGDELNYIKPGKNYEWESLPPDFPGALIGAKIAEWTPVIVPTGITFLAGDAFGPEYASSLLLLGYDDADIRRLVLSGAAFTDLDEEVPFAKFVNEGIEQKPLDVAEAPDGSLLVSTFTTIWRIRRIR